jgi:outer membrane protein assembly factor BamB
VSGAVFGSAAAAYSTNQSFTWVPDGTVYSMARDGGRIYIGGGFTSLRNPSTGQRVARAHLAALDASTGQLLSWNPGANQRVRALAVGGDGTVYAGGDFTSAGGRSAARIAAITSAGDSRTGWSASATRPVLQIRVEGGDVYIAGNFTGVNGTSRPGVAKIAASNGALDRDWNARAAGGRVHALALAPEGVIVGGAFTGLGGQPRQFLGAVSRATGAVTSWHPVSVCDSCRLIDLAVSGGNVFGAVGGGGGGRAASWSLDGNGRRWISHGDGDVQAVAVRDGVVYAGGHFGPRFDNATRHQLAAIDADNGNLLSYQLRTSGSDHPGIWDLIADADRLYVAGGFRLANSPVAHYASFSTV